MRIILGSLLCLVVLLSSVAAEEQSFKVGMILPLSGPAADYGQSIENCVNLAREDAPNDFTNIEFIFEDALHDPTKAVSAFRKLTSVDKVDLVYTWGVPFCKTLAPIAESRKVPLIGQCIDRASTAGKKYVMRFMNHTDQYLQVQTQRLKEQGHKRLALVLAEHPYLEEMLSALRRNLLDGQSVTVVDSYQIKDSDLRTTISKLRNSDFDAIGVFLYPGQISQFYRQAKEQGLSIPTFGTNFFESVSELALANGTMNGSEFTNNSVSRSFAERYEARFKNTSQLGFGALAYEFSLLVGQIFNQGPKPASVDEILARIQAAAPRKGVAAGPYDYRNSKAAGQYFHFPIVVKSVFDREFKVLG